MEVEEKKLTAKEQKFVEVYCICLNGAEAARKAGYSVDSARYIATENLTKPHIKNAIESLLTEEAMGRRETLHRITKIARGSLEPFLVEANGMMFIDLTTDEARGHLDLLKEAETKVSTRTVDERVIDTEVETKIKIHDPMAALLHMGRAHKLFTDKVETTGEVVARVVRVPAKMTPEEWSKQAQEPN